MVKIILLSLIIMSLCGCQSENESIQLETNFKQIINSEEANEDETISEFEIMFNVADYNSADYYNINKQIKLNGDEVEKEVESVIRVICTENNYNSCNITRLVIEDESYYSVEFEDKTFLIFYENNKAYSLDVEGGMNYED